jgi:hypothetical protein
MKKWFDGDEGRERIGNTLALERTNGAHINLSLLPV